MNDKTPSRGTAWLICALVAAALYGNYYVYDSFRLGPAGGSGVASIFPGTDGLLHVSEIANHRVKDVRDELKEGEQVLVKVINIDPTGKIRLSRKALLTEEGAAGAAPKA